MQKIDYTGQQFGTRLVIQNECSKQDWENVGARQPSNSARYVLTKCLVCGAIIPSDVKTLKRFPPKRCMVCSNIGNRHNAETFRNSWCVKEDCAICNVEFHKQIVSFYIDADMYDEISKYTWRISQKRQKYYVVTGSNKKGTMIYLHQMILPDRKEGYEIDHIDGNSLNNRKCNLRLITRSENARNMLATRIDNQIGVRGISYDSKSHMYHVDFSYDGNRFYVKPWENIEDAIYARSKLEELFGLTMLSLNPLAKQYGQPDDCTKLEIDEYIQDKILRDKRYNSLYTSKNVFKRAQSRIQNAKMGERKRA